MFSRTTPRIVIVCFSAIVTTAAIASQPMVGAYYYPWYGSYSGAHSTNQSMRSHLVPPQPAALGRYDGRNSGTIASHIDQSHQGNIDFWAVSWWGPSSAENTTFRSSILTHPRASELKYAIHYEATGRLGSFDSPNYANLVPDFRYLATNYFQDPNYLKVGGRPVVFIYLTRAYFNSQLSRTYVASLRSTMQSEFGVDPYIVGDDLFGPNVDAGRAQLWDAVTDFDVYGTSLQSNGSTTAALTNLASTYDSNRSALANLNVGFIPTASPGFNDSGVRSGHPAAPRYMTDDASQTEGQLFKRMLDEVVVPRVDPKANSILMVNSFNEWHEDTQIEPTITSSRTKTDDSTDQHYAQGYYYQGYGDLYLNILRGATGLAGDFDSNGVVDAADYVVWRNTLGQKGLGLAADGNRNNVVDAADYVVWRSHMGQPSATSATGSMLIPEPTNPLAFLLSACGFYSLRRSR